MAKRREAAEEALARAAPSARSCRAGPTPPAGAAERDRLPQRRSPLGLRRTVQRIERSGPRRRARGAAPPRPNRRTSRTPRRRRGSPRSRRRSPRSTATARPSSRASSRISSSAGARPPTSRAGQARGRAERGRRARAGRRCGSSRREPRSARPSARSRPRAAKPPGSAAELAAVNQFLRHQVGAPNGAPALADELDVDPGYELALAAALDGRLRRPWCDDRAAGADAARPDRHRRRPRALVGRPRPATAPPGRSSRPPAGAER